MEVTEIKIDARNRLEGEVVNIKRVAVMCQFDVRIGGVAQKKSVNSSVAELIRTGMGALQAMACRTAISLIDVKSADCKR